VALLYWMTSSYEISLSRLFIATGIFLIILGGWLDLETKACNCRKPEECPIPGRCLAEAVVYQATVSTSDNKPDQTYVGLTENSFKIRYNNHKASDPNKKRSDGHIAPWSLIRHLRVCMYGMLIGIKRTLSNTTITNPAAVDLYKTDFCLEPVFCGITQAGLNKCLIQVQHLTFFQH